MELPADHPVEGAGVAGDVDALDEDPLALDHLEVDVDGARRGVLGHLRPDLDEGVAGLAGLVAHALDDAVDQLDVVDAPAGHRCSSGWKSAAGRPGIDELTDTLPKLYCWPSETVNERKKPVRSRTISAVEDRHLQVDVAALEVELAQQLLVDLEPVGVVGVAAEDEAEPVGLAGLDHPPQPAVGEGLVADEADPLHAGLAALLDLEDEIDPVLRLRG